VEELPALLQARNQFAYGPQRDYFDHANCIGWTREGDEEHKGCAVVLSNGDAGNKTMKIGKEYAGQTFIDLLKKHPADVVINEVGWGELYVTPGSVSVWVTDQKVASRTCKYHNIDFLFACLQHLLILQIYYLTGKSDL